MNRLFKALLYRLSSFLLACHQIIDTHLKKNSAFVPYQLNYSPSPDKKKIIHFNGNFEVGGSTQLIVDIIERTSDTWYHKVVVPYIPDPIPYQPVDIHIYSIKDMASLFSFLEEEKPDLAHIHYWTRQAFRYHEGGLWYQAVFKICEELNLKVVQNINVPTTPFLSSAVIENVFVSKYVLNNFDNKSAVSSVIYPGSDFTHFHNEDIRNLPNSAIGMVYRLDWDKLNEQSIDIFIEVVKRMPDVICYIVGSGYYYHYYLNRVKEMGLINNFRFTGIMSYYALPDIYKKFKIFITPVHDESFGQVTPFAMSMGLAVAGYNTGAISEILGYTETLAPFGNVHALVEIIVEMLNNPERCIELGKKNQVRSKELFSVENMITDYRKVYSNNIN